MQSCIDCKLTEVRYWIAFLTICLLAKPLNAQVPAAQSGKSPPQSQVDQRVAISASFEAQIHQGQALQAEGLYSAAKGICFMALKNAERRDPNSVETAFALDNLASIVAEEGDFLEAQNLYARALGSLETQLGTRDEAYVKVMIHLAGVYAQTGQYSQARALLHKGLVSFTKHGSEDPTSAEILDGLGTIDALQCHYSEATTLFGRALQILETTRATFNPRLGTRNEKIALALIDLAYATAQLGRYAEAVAKAERARDLLEALSDSPPRPTIKVLTILGGLYARTGREPEAESTMARVLSMAEATYGPEHPCVANVLETYAVVLRQLKQKHEAKSMEKRARLIEQNTRRQDYGRLTVNVMTLR